MKQEASAVLSRLEWYGMTFWTELQCHELLHFVCAEDEIFDSAGDRKGEHSRYRAVMWQSIHGLAIHSPECNKSSRWSLMDLVYMATCSIHWAIHCGVLNPTKAAGGVWWIWYTWLHALFTGHCGILNPGKTKRRILEDLGVVRVKKLRNMRH